MNGKRVKALRRKFKEQHGHWPTGFKPWSGETSEWRRYKKDYLHWRRNVRRAHEPVI